MAFEDTWQWGLESEAVYKEIVTRGPRKLADLMQALLAFLERNDMMACPVTVSAGGRRLHHTLAVRLVGRSADATAGRRRRPIRGHN